MQTNPPGQPDLSDRPERQRLGPAGWKFFGRLMAIWGVPPEQSRQLLGIPVDASLDDVDGMRLTEEQRGACRT